MRRVNKRKKKHALKEEITKMKEMKSLCLKLLKQSLRITLDAQAASHHPTTKHPKYHCQQHMAHAFTQLFVCVCVCVCVLASIAVGKQDFSMNN